MTRIRGSSWVARSKNAKLPRSKLTCVSVSTITTICSRRRSSIRRNAFSLLGVVSTAAMAGLFVRSPETMSRNKRCLYTIRTAVSLRLRSCNAPAVCSSSVSLDVTPNSVPKVGSGTVSVDPPDQWCHCGHVLLPITHEAAVPFHCCCAKKTAGAPIGLCQPASATLMRAERESAGGLPASSQGQCLTRVAITVLWYVESVAGGGGCSIFLTFARVYLTLSAMQIPLNPRARVHSEGGLSARRPVLAFSLSSPPRKALT